MHRGALALAAGCAHLVPGFGDSPQSAPPTGLPNPRGGSRGVRLGSAEERRVTESAVHRSVHGAHPVQLREDTGGGEAVRGAESAQPGRVQDDRPALQPAGRVHPPQLCELRAYDDVQTGADSARDQRAVSRGYIRFLQLGAVRCAGCLRPAQRGTSGAVESQVPLLLQIPKECPRLDCARQLGTNLPQNTGANNDSSDDHLPRAPASPRKGGNKANVNHEFLT